MDDELFDTLIYHLLLRFLDVVMKGTKQIKVTPGSGNRAKDSAENADAASENPEQENNDISSSQQKGGSDPSPGGGAVSPAPAAPTSETAVKDQAADCQATVITSNKSQLPAAAE